MNNRSNPPSEVKQILRKESYFGCCICGNPIIQYHHIIPWKIEHHYRPKDMMSLCPNHHDEVTKGAIIEKDQRNYKENPFNKQNGYVNGCLKINHNIPIIKIGNCNFFGSGELIQVDDKNLVSVNSEDQRILISLKLYNELNNLILEINENDWISGNSEPWDLEASYQYLKIRHKKRQIALEVNTKQEPIMLRCTLWYNGQKFDISNNRILFNGVKKGIGMENIDFVGKRLIANTNTENFEINDSSHVKKGCIAVGQSIETCLQLWEENKL